MLVDKAEKLLPDLDALANTYIYLQARKLPLSLHAQHRLCCDGTVKYSLNQMRLRSAAGKYVYCSFLLPWTDGQLAD